MSRWILMLGGLVVVATLLLLGTGASRLPYTPEQPIAFSHLKHAGDLNMSCAYCHTNARRSSVAGLPSVKRCMGCHDLVLSDNAEIEKLAGYLERDEPVEWTKVFDLPDHTKFFHDRHIKAGVKCDTCHGSVETMERVTRTREFKMGWCIDCHRQQGASIDCLDCHH